ncbi:MAG: hypothetical protein JW881_19215 [Spirochaetales bacterium]|nr:hypothetical protein [Spirochaetales bacterium]
MVNRKGIVGIAIVLVILIQAGYIYSQDDIQSTMPVYLVVKGGVTEEEAYVLASSLGLGDEFGGMKGMPDENGLLSFVDTERFQLVPTRQLRDVSSDEDGNKTIAESIDMKALKEIRAYPGEKALERFGGALKKAGLLTFEAREFVKNSELVICENETGNFFRVGIDTKVGFNRYLKGIPLTGAGSKTMAIFDPRGTVTNLLVADRDLKEGAAVELLTPKEVEERLRETYGKEIGISTRLVYYAPPLAYANVKVIVPHYLCSITEKGNNEETVRLDELIPAVRDLRYVPSAIVKASFDGDVLKGKVDIRGGAPPYDIQWNIGGSIKTSGNEVLVYKLDARTKIDRQYISATITDQNGISVTAGTAVALDPSFTATATIQPPVIIANYRQFGTENSVTNQFGDLEQGFVNQMLADGVAKRFQWKGKCAWEQDFKSPMDYYYIDNTDITLYVGHGSPTGFTFVDTTHDDYKLDYNDADNDWGDRDLEWLALYSCQVLNVSYPPLSLFERWRQEFDGLHLLLGFHTNAQANSGFTNAFASNMVDSDMTVRASWFKAINTDQPSDRVGVVMGAGMIDSGGNWIWNWNDHFWGHGSVGPDIPQSKIDFYWALICW